MGGTLTGRGGNLIIIDDPLKPAEAMMACNILNRMIALGRPESFAIGD